MLVTHKLTGALFAATFRSVKLRIEFLGDPTHALERGAHTALVTDLPGMPQGTLLDTINNR